MTIHASRTTAKRKSRNVALTALRVSGRVLYERVARPMAHTLEEILGQFIAYSKGLCVRH